MCKKKGTFGSGTDSRIGSGSIKLIYKSKYGSISVYKSRFSARKSIKSGSESKP